MKFVINKKLLHQTLVVVPVCFNEFMIGVGYGWIAPTLKKFEDPSNDISITAGQYSWIGSLHEFARFFGPPLAAFLLNSTGRKVTLMLSTITFFLSWLGIFAFKSVLVIYLSRFIFGIGTGLSDVSSSVYIGENSSPTLRGIFSSFTIIFFYFGMIAEFLIATYLPYHTVSIVNLAIACLALLSTALLKETPLYLITKENFENAGVVLMWLQGTSMWNDVSTEFETLKQNVQAEKSKTSWREIFSSPASYKSLAIGLTLNLLTTSTGFAALTAFSSILFVSSNVFSSYEYTILYGFSQLVAAGVSIVFIERFNRKSLLEFSFSTFVILHLCACFAYYYQESIANSVFSWLIFGTVTAYASVYAFFYPIVHIIRGELFPQSIKALGSCVTIMAHSGSGFVSAKIFMSIANCYGMYVNFLLFSMLSLIALVFTFFRVPETRGKSLVDIQKLFQK